MANNQNVTAYAEGETFHTSIIHTRYLLDYLNGPFFWQKEELINVALLDADENLVVQGLLNTHDADCTVVWNNMPETLPAGTYYFCHSYIGVSLSSSVNTNLRLDYMKTDINGRQVAFVERNPLMRIDIPADARRIDIEVNSFEKTAVGSNN